MSKKAKTDLVLFIFITLTSGWIGVFVDHILTGQPKGQSLGMGIWLVSPFFCAIFFRIREKEWKSAGLGLYIRKGWKGYLIAVFIYPAITAVTLFPAMYFGCADAAANSWITFRTLVLASFAGSFLKNIFEEFAWRGFLTPKLLESGLNDWLVYGISGMTWGLWHSAYYLVFLGNEYFTDTSRLQMLLSGCFIMILWSILFTEVYRMTKSVWPCVIMHTMEAAFPAVIGATVQFNTIGQVIFHPETGLVAIILILSAGLYLRSIRIRRCSGGTV